MKHLVVLMLAVHMAAAAQERVILSRPDGSESRGMTCGNLYYDDGTDAGYIGIVDLTNPNLMFGVLFDPNDIGALVCDIEEICFGNSWDMQEIWSSQVLVVPDNGGIPEIDNVLAETRFFIGDGTGDYLIPLDPPIRVESPFWVILRGHPENLGAMGCEKSYTPGNTYVMYLDETELRMFYEDYSLNVRATIATLVSIPTLSQTALIIFASMLAVAGVISMRIRRTRSKRQDT